MDEMDFLEQAAAADSSAAATLMVLLPDGSVTQIHNINRFTVLEKCPLLFHAFEFRECGDVEQASIEVSVFNTVPRQKFEYTVLSQEEQYCTQTFDPVLNKCR